MSKYYEETHLEGDGHKKKLIEEPGGALRKLSEICSWSTLFVECHGVTVREKRKLN